MIARGDGHLEHRLLWKLSLRSKDGGTLRTPQIEDTVNVRDVIWENVEDTTAVTAAKNFVRIDIDSLIYDFRLDSISPAIGKAMPIEGLPHDRVGVLRDEEPDLGCYEYARKEE